MDRNGIGDLLVMLGENQDSFNLPEDAFVFSMHQGFEFNYFRFSEG